MKRILPFIFLLAIVQSCIPLRIAPSIDDYKLTKGKKFKRGLPKRTVFIFEDPKEKKVNEFYNFVNSKFQLEHENVYDDVPFNIRGQQYFFSFYETDIPDKTINFLPIIFNAMWNSALNIEDDDNEPGPSEIRTNNYYIAIEVYNDIEKDCLEEDALSREAVLKYLRTLKKEYLSTHNYNELVFKN